VVAGGISEALIATAAGLVVAIVAVLTYNMFVTFANQTSSALKLVLEEILDQAYDPAGART
jgi:biopolymer transport protein ExbB/TolQ